MLLTWPCRRDLILQRLFYTQPMHLPYPNIVKIGDTSDISESRGTNHLPGEMG